MHQWNKIRGRAQLYGTLLAVPLILWCSGLRSTAGMWREYRGKIRAVEQLHAAGTPSVRPSAAVSLVETGKLLGQIGQQVARDGLAVIKYSPVLTREEGKLKIHTGELVVAGGFVPLLRLAAYIGRNCESGRIVSLAFRTHRDLQNKERQLRLTLFIQQITET